MFQRPKVSSDEFEKGMLVMNFLTTIAEAGGGDGSSFLGFLIIFGFLYVIYKALTKKKSYRFGGTIYER